MSSQHIWNRVQEHALSPNGSPAALPQLYRLYLRQPVQNLISGRDFHVGNVVFVLRPFCHHTTSAKNYSLPTSVRKGARVFGTASYLTNGCSKSRLYLVLCLQLDRTTRIHSDTTKKPPLYTHSSLRSAARIITNNKKTTRSHPLPYTET